MIIQTYNNGAHAYTCVNDFSQLINNINCLLYCY